MLPKLLLYVGSFFLATMFSFAASAPKQSLIVFGGFNYDLGAQLKYSHVETKIPLILDYIGPLWNEYLAYYTDSTLINASELRYSMNHSDTIEIKHPNNTESFYPRTSNMVNSFLKNYGESDIINPYNNNIVILTIANEIHIPRYSRNYDGDIEFFALAAADSIIDTIMNLTKLGYKNIILKMDKNNDFQHYGMQSSHRDYYSELLQQYLKLFYSRFEQSFKSKFSSDKNSSIRILDTGYIQNFVSTELKNEFGISTHKDSAFIMNNSNIEYCKDAKKQQIYRVTSHSKLGAIMAMATAEILKDSSFEINRENTMILLSKYNATDSTILAKYKYHNDLTEGQFFKNGEHELTCVAENPTERGIFNGKIINNWKTPGEVFIDLLCKLKNGFTNLFA